MKIEETVFYDGKKYAICSPWAKKLTICEGNINGKELFIAVGSEADDMRQIYFDEGADALMEYLDANRCI